MNLSLMTIILVAIIVFIILFVFFNIIKINGGAKTNRTNKTESVFTKLQKKQQGLKPKRNIKKAINFSNKFDLSIILKPEFITSDDPNKINDLIDIENDLTTYNNLLNIVELESKNQFISVVDKLTDDDKIEYIFSIVKPQYGKLTSIIPVNGSINIVDIIQYLIMPVIGESTNITLDNKILMLLLYYSIHDKNKQLKSKYVEYINSMYYYIHN